MKPMSKTTGTDADIKRVNDLIAPYRIARNDDGAFGPCFTLQGPAMHSMTTNWGTVWKVGMDVAAAYRAGVDDGRKGGAA